MPAGFPPQHLHPRLVEQHHQHPLFPFGMAVQQLLTPGVEPFGSPAGSQLAGALHQQPRQDGEGRIQPRAPPGELHLEEGAIVLTGRCLDDLILRLVCLHDHLAGDRPSARTARHLGQQLEGALPAAIVRQVQRHVRCHHAHQGHLREVEALGDHLRTNEDPRPPGTEFIQDLRMSLLAGGGIHVHAGNAHAGEQLFQLVLHLLRARAEEPDVLARAFRAGGRRVGHVAAVVAVQSAVAASHVIGQRHITVGTFHRQSAAAAADEGIVAAPVHQEHRLLAAGHAVLQLLHHQPGEHAAVAAFDLPAHVHHRDLRHGPVVHAMGHLQQGVIPPARLGKGQDARRGRGQQKRRAFVLGAESSHVPRVVAGMAVRQVGRLVLLVHHDDAQVLAGGEHRAAGTDDHLGLSAPNAPPFIKAFPGGQPRMQHRRRIAEACAEPADHLRGQGDLRHQDDGGLPPRQHMAHQADKHLGLARAGHAVEQVFPPPHAQVGQHHVQRLLLIGRQRRVDDPVDGLPRRAAQHLRLLQADKPQFLQCVQRLQRVAHEDAQLLHRVDFTIPQEVQ